MSVGEIAQGLEERIYSDGSVDYIQMITQTGIIGRISAITIGLLSTIIMIFVPFIVAIEIIYICFPFIRDKFEEFLIKVEGTGVKRNILGFTLRDARKAVEDANIVYSGEHSALWLYLIIKCKSLLFLMFIVCWVVQGTTGLVSFVWQIIGNTLQSLF